MLAVVEAGASGCSWRRAEDVKGRMRREMNDGNWWVVMVVARRMMRSDVRVTMAERGI